MRDGAVRGIKSTQAQRELSRRFNGEFKRVLNYLIY
jgi:hypothetical protein